jgi:solute carrier family 25 S-adenosylmethionine transporter 26
MWAFPRERWEIPLIRDQPFDAMNGFRRRLYLTYLVCSIGQTSCFHQSLLHEGRRCRQYLKANHESARDENQPVVSRSLFLTSVLTFPLIAQAGSNVPVENNSTRQDTSNDRETLQESVSGAMAGSALTVLKSAVKYPLDTATVRLQMPNSGYSLQRPIELFDDSYRGVLIPLVSNIPAGATFFAAKDACRAILKQQQPGLPKWLATCIAVGAAQLPYWVVRNPSEVFKTRQQSGAPGFGEGVTAVQAYQSMYNETNSLDSFYVGYWENILYAYPADVIKFGLYEAITGGGKKVSLTEGAVAGALSTAIAQFLTTPLDVIRNRIMVQSSNIASDVSGSQSSYIGALYNLGRDEGWEGMFAGSLPRVGKALLSGAVQFATYEETKQKMQAFFLRKNGQ